MTRDEYRATAHRLGNLNSPQVAALVGVSTKAAQAWHQGVTDVPEPIRRLLVVIEAVGVPKFLAILAKSPSIKKNRPANPVQITTDAAEAGRPARCST